MTLRVGVLASGAGTNLQAILDRVHGSGGVEVVGVGSDKPGAQALERAALARAWRPRCSSAASTRTARRATSRWRAGCRAAASQLVVLAGYMQLLDPAFLSRFAGQVINVHPALLPAFPGIRAVEQALDYGVKVFGVTVHFVDEGVDTGPIILQRAVDLPLATEAERGARGAAPDRARPAVRGGRADRPRRRAPGPGPSAPRAGGAVTYRPAPMRGTA